MTLKTGVMAGEILLFIFIIYFRQGFNILSNLKNR